MPSGVTHLMEAGRPSKAKVWVQKRQRRVSGVQSLKRTASGIWLSSGKISLLWAELEEVEEVIEYFLVSSPRHSARCMASVAGMGAQRRSMGGKICLYRYHSMSGFRVEEAETTSCGAKARLAAGSEEGIEDEAVEVMM